jgi:TRAP-type uncharacterized transport system fused permease subunit
VGRGVGVWQVGGISMALAIAGFIIPYIFIYNTVLLLIDFNLYPFLWILLRTVFLLGLISIIVQGYAHSRVSLWEKGMYAFFCILLLIQHTTANLAGMALSILFVLLMWRLRSRPVTAPKEEWAHMSEDANL